MHTPRLLYGGTFDPVHLGHLRGAALASQVSGVPLVTFLPCQQSPHKDSQPSIEPSHRLALLECALRHCSWAEIDRRELLRQGPSATWKTVQSYREEEPHRPLNWLLGGDQWEVIDTWEKPDFLAEHLHFYVLERGGVIRPRQGWRYTPIAFEQQVSSTQIRTALGQQKDRSGWSDWQEWLEPQVYQYIQKHGLYREE